MLPVYGMGLADTSRRRSRAGEVCELQIWTGVAGWLGALPPEGSKRFSQKNKEDGGPVHGLKGPLSYTSYQTCYLCQGSRVGLIRICRSVLVSRLSRNGLVVLAEEIAIAPIRAL